MRFALLSDWKRWPCEEAQLEELFAKEFSALGHRIHWLAFISGQAEEERRLEWRGHAVTLRRRESGTILPARRWLKDLLRRGELDFVQVRNDPGLALLARGLARAAGIPFVYHLTILNGPVLRDEAARESFPRSAALRVKGAVGGALVDLVARECDLLLPISDAMAAHYRAQGRTGPTAALPMGCRDAAYAPAPERAGPPEALYLGALDRVRGLELLLDALVVARKEVPDLRLAFLGSARREADVDWLKQRARALGLESCVSFEPLVPRGAVAARLARADFGVSPVPPTPYYLLSSPTKLMECLGAGRPVVANDIPEQKHLLEASGGGLCVPYAAEAFGRAMARLAADPALRADMGRRGAAYMAGHREYALLARRAEKAYEDLLRSRGRTP